MIIPDSFEADYLARAWIKGNESACSPIGAIGAILENACFLGQLACLVHMLAGLLSWLAGRIDAEVVLVDYSVYSCCINFPDQIAQFSFKGNNAANPENFKGAR